MYSQDLTNCNFDIAALRGSFKKKKPCASQGCCQLVSFPRLTHFVGLAVSLCGKEGCCQMDMLQTHPYK